MTAVRRGILGVVAALLVWELGARLNLPLLAAWPPPTEVAQDLVEVASSGGYWSSWQLSFERVFWGFVIALLLGIPFGLMHGDEPLLRSGSCSRPSRRCGRCRRWRGCRWRSFLADAGALDHVRDLPRRLLHGRRQRRRRRASRSTAATCSPRGRSAPAGCTLFWRVILPAALPSIFTGAAVGMGITWEVVVAAELISGGGQDAADGGLGFLVWNSYQGGDTRARGGRHDQPRRRRLPVERRGADRRRSG